MAKKLGTAIVTGASTGIGAVFADRLARRGYDLVLVGRNAGRLKDVAATMRGRPIRIDVLVADLADADQLARVEARIEAESTLSLLVNNAGLAPTTPALETSSATWQEMIAVNVTAPLILSAAAARGFAARGGGGIINLSSVSALVPEMGDPAYAGTKAFLLALGQGQAMQWKEQGIRVQIVLPAITRTQMWAQPARNLDHIPPKMVMEPSDLVDAALAGFDRGEIVTIPSLEREEGWEALQATRLALGPTLMNGEVATRYRSAE